ncbi:hypothetical protein P4361_18565 [Fictibacillus sp. B-59209]|uniref:hypothetical protein n=1 Tax=Fictibacillus sp. B-59209 TaxID=3024873 RepID=UPI002E201392|nr:hypothetical protein [Fictibacillus sp. B-59209]
MDQLKLNEMQESLLVQIKDRIKVYQQHMRNSDVDRCHAIMTVISPLATNLHHSLSVEPSFSEGVLEGAKEEGLEIPSIAFYSHFHAVQDLVDWLDREVAHAE